MMSKASKKGNKKQRSHTGTHLTAWFLGPKAENAELWQQLFLYIFGDYIHWRRNYIPSDPIVISREQRRKHEAWLDELTTQLDTILNKLKAHYPFYSPRYLAHMLSEQTLPSVLGYFAGMLYNPNNVTEEAAPVTVELEIQVGKMVSEMLGFSSKEAWAHITSGGTIANLEALWIARVVNFIPFIFKEFCASLGKDFNVTLPSGNEAPISKLGPTILMHMQPSESIGMFRRFALRLNNNSQLYDEEKIRFSVNEYLQKSKFNPCKVGYGRVIHNISKVDGVVYRPRIFVSAAAHYCVDKAANILGYGEDCVRKIPVNKNFRMDIDKLRSEIDKLEKNEYIAAVIGVVGTTEEGAVDPVHELIALRTEYEKREKKSFWIHLDAAWGGYIRSLFCETGIKNRKFGSSEQQVRAYIKAIKAKVTQPEAIDSKLKDKISWKDPEIYASFLAMSKVDSICVDPHKMGYIPYPAGIIAFKDKRVTDLVGHIAPYVSHDQAGISKIEEWPDVKDVGNYIIEGSKPGAAAAACWLAHTTIPLKMKGHGKIIRTTLLNASRLHAYLNHHQRKLFFDFEKGEKSHTVKKIKPFTFIPLFIPDTNVVCFITTPMNESVNPRRLTPEPSNIMELNLYNEVIYKKLSLKHSAEARQLPYGHEYFVSHTQFKADKYSYSTVRKLDDWGVKEEDYNKEGLFVLRTTVMNPFYKEARKRKQDYLLKFVQHIHDVAKEVWSMSEKDLEKELIK